MQRNSLKEIIIKTIPHRRQRYETCGDYFNNGKGVTIHISQFNNPDYEFAIAVHELIEWYLTKKRGIKIKEIDNFDMAFKGEGEPGDSKDAPYYWEHQFATDIEKQVIYELGIPWDVYESDVDAISSSHEDDHP